MYLQLAEGRTPVTPSGDSLNPFIFIPDISGQNKGLYVREDYFDSLSDYEFNQMMRKLAPFQPDVKAGQMSEDRFLSSRASRKAKRRDKDAEKDAKKRTKAETKKENKDRRASTIANLVSTVGGVASSIFGKKAPGSDLPEDSGGSPLPGPEEKGSLLTNPLVIGAGILIVGGVIYFATRPKKVA